MRSSDRIMARHRGSIQFSSRDMDFTFNYLLGQADLLTGHGPLFATAQRIRGASPSAWRREFGRLADHAHRQTTAAHAAGGTAQARLWALTDCYANRAALQYTDPESASFTDRWQRMEEAFSTAMAYWSAPVSAIEVPWQPASLPGYLVKLDDQPRPAIVMVGGGDTSREDLFCFAGLPAWQQGYNAILVDLPGQGSTPARGMHFTVDMARPIRAVIDHLYRLLPYTTRVAIYGVSGGGYFSCQAVAEDSRIAAWIAATPIHDIAEVFRQEFGAALGVPGWLPRLLLKGTGGFNEATELSLKRYAWQFGTSDFVQAVEQVYQQARSVDHTAIYCPALFCYSTAEGPELRRQTGVLARALRSRGVPVTVRRCTAIEGADAHCQINNLRLAHAVIFDWLAGCLGPVASTR